MNLVLRAIHLATFVAFVSSIIYLVLRSNNIGISVDSREVLSPDGALPIRLSLFGILLGFAGFMVLVIRVLAKNKFKKWEIFLGAIQLIMILGIIILMIK